MGQYFHRCIEPLSMEHCPSAYGTERVKAKLIIISYTTRLLSHSHTKTPFDAPGKQAFENTVGKGEIARDEQFLLFPQCFLPV